MKVLWQYCITVPESNVWVVHKTIAPSWKHAHITARLLMHHVLFKIHEAVVYIHQKGLLHRDLNPSNVFLSREGGSVKVGDFGLVSGLDVDDNTTRKQVLKYVCYTYITRGQPHPKYNANSARTSHIAVWERDQEVTGNELNDGAERGPVDRDGARSTKSKC